MNASARLRQWWLHRNPRERAMVAVMLAALTAFVCWYGVLLPVRSVRDAARQDYAAAVHTLRLVQADSVRLQALSDRSPRDPAALAATLEQRALQAGVALSRQRRDSQDRWVVELDAVDARALFAWLELLQAEDGVQPVGLTAERDGARLRAEATFAPTPP